MRCDECEPLLLDLRYGLLDPAEEAAVREHLQTCAACSAAVVAADRAADLFARAAKMPFPDVKFVPPTDAEPARPKPVARWTPWAIAAGVLLAVGGAGLPVVRSLNEYAAKTAGIDARVAALGEQVRETEAKRADWHAKQRDAEAAALRARDKHDAITKEWAKAVSPPDRPLRVSVTGPAAATPGAPNEYTLSATDAAGKPVNAKFELTVRDAAGKEYFRYAPLPRESAVVRPATVKLPVELWAKLPQASSDIILSVTATNPTTGATAELAEPLKLAAPVYRTFLTTDKPQYRPGEPLFFRGLTLERTTFLPPAHDLTMRIELRRADGTLVPKMVRVGRTSPVKPTAGGLEPVLGPDGKPVRGVSCGTLLLPGDLPGGEYTLTAFELPADKDDVPPGAVPVATRTVLVNDRTPDRFLKKLDFDASTYGPGDPVRATLTVMDQKTPAKGVIVSPSVAAGVELINPAGDTKTDDAGRAVFRFTLPKSPDLKDVALTVQLDKDGVLEAITRRVPLATKALTLEFFPEGGDLIAGVPNRVYLRATTAFGTPADVQGYLTDGTDRVCEIATLTDAENPGANRGMGVFAFTPKAGAKYRVKLLRPVGAVEPADGFALPAAKADGVALSIPGGVFDPNQPIVATVASPQKRTLLVGAYVRGVAAAHERVVVEAGQPKEVKLAMPAGAAGGVTRVTVFEERADRPLLPLAERLVFRRPPQSLTLAVGGADAAFAPGDRVRLDIAATTDAGKPTAAVLWVAVVNQNVITSADDTADRLLPTHFLLAGEVQKPDRLEYADFLLTTHPKAAAALDLLLGTQGWRRFAEQTKQFRATDKADADRFIAAQGMTPAANARSPDAAGDTYRQPHEVAAKELADATRAAADADRGLRESAAGLDSAKRDIDRAEAERRFAGTKLSDDLLSPIVLGPPLLVAVVGFFVYAFTRPTGSRWRVAGYIGVGLLIGGAGLLLTLAKQTRDYSSSAGAMAKAAGGGEGGPPPAAPLNLDPRESARPNRKSGDIREGAGREARDQIVVPIAALLRKGVAPATAPKEIKFDDPRDQLTAREAFGPQVDESARRQQLERASADRVKRDVLRPGAFVVREYAHARPTPPPDDPTRSDFTETVFWHPLLVLPADGKASVSFQLPDSIAAHRVLVAGHTLDGRLGATTTLLEVRKPLAADVKLPAEIGSGDTLRLAVSVANGTPTAADTRIGVWSDHLTVTGDEVALPLAPRSGGRHLFDAKPRSMSGVAHVRAAASAGPHSDAVERSLTVVPEGYPVAGAANEVLEKTGRVSLTVPKSLVPGTLGVKVTVYANALADVQAGLDGLLREPHGCFEQTSSSNYPNVLVLGYLKELDRLDPAVADRARTLLERGYNRLTGFEVPTADRKAREGFEWFGAFPPHEPLSAYGLVQFADMAAVFPVDPAVIDRTRTFLLSRRDGDGGFRRANDGHTFGAAPPAVVNAYVAWAITEADRRTNTTSDIGKEVDAAAAEATKSGDPYRLALAAAAVRNRGGDAATLLTKLAALQKPDGGLPPGEATVCRSGGADRETETTALAALAWQAVPRPNPFEANARTAVKWLAARRGPHGAFGATQATVLALKALVTHAKQNRRPVEDGEVVVKVNGQEVGRRPLRTDAADPLAFDIPDAEKLFADPAEVTLESTVGGAYPFAVAWAARTRTPATDPNCPLKLTTALDKPTAAEGELVRLTVRVENATAAGHGMAVATVGLPAGLKLPDDLKQIRSLTLKPADGEPTVAHWEKTGRELTLYWRGLAPKQTVSATIDLIADVPGTFRGPAGRAYLYYTAESKAWVEPLAVTVNPAK